MCLIFNFLNDKIHNYVLLDIIVNFIIQKLKNQHTFLKKYTNWAKLSSLILTERVSFGIGLFSEMIFSGL